MPHVLNAAGQAILWPFKKFRAHCRRNAIIIAHMTPEELREYKRMRDELRLAHERRREYPPLFRLPGANSSCE